MSHDHTAKRNVSRSIAFQLGLTLLFGLALTMGLLGAFSLDGAHKRSAYAAPPSGPALQSSQSTTTTITSDRPDPSLVGESFTVSFTVASGSTAPTGTVTVTLGMGTYTGTLGFGVDVCTDTLTEGPSVTSTGGCILMPSVAGNGTLTATYGGEGDFGSSLDTEPHRVTDSDLSIAKTADPDPATAGRSMVYTLTIANRGSVSATNVTISDTLPSSLTLHSVDQTDDNSGAFSFPNGTHQNTIWDTGRPATGEDDWLRIANTVTPTGVYTSSVLDGYNLVEWDELHWVPRRPYGKPLPDWGQAESAYDRGNANMTGNAVLLHLDALYSASYPTGTVILPPTDSRGTVSDTSGLTTPVACQSCPAVTGDGRFGNAFDFDGALSQTVVISDATDPARYALELWVRPEALTDTSLILRTNAAQTDTVKRYSHILGLADGHFRHTVYDGEYRTITSTTSVTVGTWYHLVGTAQSGGELELYVNGEREARLGGLDALWAEGDHYRLGSSYSTTRTSECLSGTLRFPCVVTDTRQYFSGTLDEVAIYSRTLSSAEIRDHYLRGALQLQLEARSCAQADCVDGAWKGPYSEADNDSLELPEAAIDVPNNRYFQYRATLTTEDASFSPELHSTTVHPGHRAVTATQGSCWATYHAFTCTLGTLAPGQVVTVSTGANIHHAALGIITNTASVTAPGEVITGNNTVALTTTVGTEADLIILKHDDETEMDSDTDEGWDVGGSDPVNPGSTLTYTLRVRNGGPSTARWVTVTDQLPAGLIGYATGGDGWTCGPPSNTVTCTLESLGPTYSWREQYDWEHIIVTATAPLTESVITNTAWITSATFETITDTEDNLVTETTSIEPVADVSIEKLDAPDPVDPGATLLYTVTVTNHGPYTNVTGVVVTDTLPDGLAGHVVDGGDWSCSTSDGQLICDLLHPLTPTLSASFNVTVTAPMSGFLANYVHVTADPYDPDDDNNWDAAYTAVRPVADLFVSKQDTPDPVNAAAPLTYTVIVTNTGPVDAGAFTTTVEASNGHDFRIHPRGGRAAPYRTSIYLSSVPGLLRDLTVTLHDVSHSYPSDLSLLLVGPDERAVVLMANAGGGSDVDDLTLTFNDDGVAVGEPITSTVVYRPTNNGFSEDFEPPAPAGPYGSSLSTFYNTNPNGHWRLYVYDTVYSDGGSIGGWSLEVTGSTTDTVTLSDTLPAELSGVNVTSPSGWNCGAGTDPLMCEADWLPVDAPAVFTITATAPITGGTSAGSGYGVITNTVAVTSTIADLGPHANTATITTTVAAVADLGISKRVMPSDVVEPGAPLTYTLTVSNAGPSPLLTPLVVTDTLPAGLTDVNVSGTDWDCDALTPTMTCTRTDGLSVGPASEIVISANAPLTPETVLTNTAGVTATVIDPALVNNSAIVTVTVAERADLQIVKSAQPTALMPNAVVTYTLSITNAGPSVARDVLVSDTLVNASTIGTPSGWGDCGRSGDTFTCTASSLEVGAAADIVVTVTAPSTGGVITNTAEITGSVVDPDDTNNADVITVAVSYPPTITVPLDAYETDEDVTAVITFTVGDPDTPLADLDLARVISNEALIPSGNVTLGGAGANRTVTLTPTANLHGQCLVTITVSDGLSLGGSDTFTLTVNPVNDPPAFTSTPVEQATVGESYIYTVTADDVDIGDVLTVTAPISPAWLSLTSVNTRTARLSGTPDEAHLGDQSVSLLVRDTGDLTDTQPFTITVRRGTYGIYLPLVLRNYVTAPDLVVDDIVATSDAITVTISNQGDATITATVENEFWLDVYLNPSSAPTYNQTWAHLCDEGLIWGITQDALPLTPGDTLTLTTSRYQDGTYYRPNESEVTWPLPAGTEVWAQVDSTNQDTDYGAVLENHEIIGAPYEEGGNVMGPVTSTADAVGQDPE